MLAVTQLVGFGGLLGAVGGTLTNVSSQGSTIESSHNGAFVPANAFDGNTGTFWFSGESGAGVSGVSYLGRNLSAAYDVTRIKIYQDNVSGGAVTSYLVQRSSDGSAWTTVATENSPVGLGVTTTDFASVGSYQYWRVLANSASNGGTTRWSLYEMEIWAMV